MDEFTYEKDADGIVTVTMNMDGPVNAMNNAFRPLYADMVNRLEAEEELKGVILTSGKESFFAGGDLKRLVAIERDELPALFDEVEGIKADMRRLERLPVPVVAAINGTALGGGYELCLATNYRIAADNPKSRIGLPEVTLGLLPGGGGVVRLTYLLGLEAAMPLLVEGKQLVPTAALKAGLVDEVVAADALLARSREWILSAQDNAAAATQPWDTKGYRIPGGGSNSPKLALKIAGASAMLFQKTKGLQPAPTKILDIMVEAGGKLNFDTALRYESRRFCALVVSPEAKNMISTFFFGLNQVNSGASRPKDIPSGQVKKLGIMGAGMMGQGIAYSSAMAGIDVVLSDMTQQAAERGKSYSEKLLAKRVERGRMEAAKAAEVLDRIHPSADREDLRGCDMIIEAVFEKVEVKDEVIANTEAYLADNGVWGSNTSTLPISRLASKARNPKNFVGMHFFSPVDKMPLLEIIAGQETSDETLARAFDFAQQIRKTPIIVGDKMGFYTSRTIGTKVIEAVQMVAEGHDPLRVDNLSRLIGMPTGMLSLLDEVQIKLATDIYRTQIEMGLLDPAKEQNPEARAMLEDMLDNHNRHGRATGKGFYDYFDGGKTIWPGLSKWRREDAEISDQDIQDRILFRAVLESLHCLEEGVLRSVADGNIGSIMGIGAPVHTGGYIQYVNGYGLDRFIARCEALAGKYGQRFQPPAILRDHAAQGRLFH